MATANQVKFQLLVDIPNDENIHHYLVLPSIFKNQLDRNCTQIAVVDSRGERYGVFVYDEGIGSVRIGHWSWPVFYETNVQGQLGITKLCFRLLRRHVFEVLCFNSTGKQMIRNEAGQLVMKRCLLEATDAIVDKEFLPSRILNDMNQESVREPVWKAKLSGPKQNGDVDVIYLFYENNKEQHRWRAVGFKGSVWTNFVIENGIERGFTMMFTYIGDQKFVVDVFNLQGIGVGLIDSSVEADIDEVYSDEDSDGDYLHECRLKKHRHRGQPKPYFMFKFPDHPVTTKRLTVPKSFVSEHELYSYNRAVMLYGHMKFKAKLHINPDPRRPNDLTHVHMIRDWSYFLKQTGFMVGEPVHFELNKEKSVVGGDAHFRVC